MKLSLPKFKEHRTRPPPLLPQFSYALPTAQRTSSAHQHMNLRKVRALPTKELNPSRLVSKRSPK
jgi:hypothetical protein